MTKLRREASEDRAGGAPVAEIPPHEAGRHRKPADRYKTLSGFEGREDELGQSIAVVLKMLGNHAGYAHEINDPLDLHPLFARYRGTSRET